MIATDWRQLGHALRQNSVDIPLADPHFWTLQGSVRVAQICHEWGLTWGSHSNNHFDISLAMFTMSPLLRRGESPPSTRTGSGRTASADRGAVPHRRRAHRRPRPSGLGVEPDMERIERAHQLYKEMGLGARDDAKTMQSLIPGWTFDNKRPAWCDEGAQCKP